MLYNIGKFLFYIYFRLFRRVKIEGRENIPKEGPLLLYANHPSAWDMILIGVFMKRKVHYMAKAELFKKPFLAWLFRSLGAFPVNRGKGDVGSVKTVFRLLDEGKVVGIFPEGTRTPRKDPQKRKAGAALLAARSGVPVMPVGVVWNKKIFSRVSLVFGKPFIVQTENEGEHIGKDKLMEITSDIIDKIYALIGQ